jgi:UDP-glucose 6-dehydrogenase
MNELANLCEKVGADAEMVRVVSAEVHPRHDKRFLRAHECIRE